LSYFAFIFLIQGAILSQMVSSMDDDFELHVKVTGEWRKVPTDAQSARNELSPKFLFCGMRS
jgi:hypothetical protein